MSEVALFHSIIFLDGDLARKVRLAEPNMDDKAHILRKCLKYEIEPGMVLENSSGENAVRKSLSPDSLQTLS